MEDFQTEYKREFIADIDKEIVAFLNSKGGTIFVGLDDDGKIYKPFLNVKKDDIDVRIGNILENNIYPSAFNLISFSFNEKGVLVIKINEGTNKPYYLKEKGPRPSGVYLRVGSSIRKASEDEILLMIMNSKNYDFESDISDEQNLTFVQLSKAFERKQLSLTDKEKRNLGIINIDNLFTNFGLIISDQSPIEVKLAEYDSHMNFKIKKVFKGSIVKIIDDVQEQADRLNDVSAVIDGTSFERKETRSYPSVALREIILNAFCHANYFIRSNIKIEFFESNVRIISPGGIYKATFKDLLSGTLTYRNPKLVHLLDKLGYIENFGTGLPRTFDSYKNTGKEPIFNPSDNFFIVTLPNLNYDNNENRQINRQINDLGLSILKLINSKPGIKVPEIYNELSLQIKNLNLDKIRYELKTELKDLVELKGSKKTGGYYIKEKINK